MELSRIAERIGEVPARQLWVHAVQVAQREWFKEVAVSVDNLHASVEQALYCKT